MLGLSHHTTTPSRMSNLEPLITLPDWREEYSPYLSSSDSARAPPSPWFGESTSHYIADAPITEELFALRTQLEHRRCMAQLGKLMDAVPAIDRPRSTPPADSGYSTSNSLNPESEPARLSGVRIASNSTSPSPTMKAGLVSNDEMEIKDEEIEEYDDEDDMDEEVGDTTVSEAEGRAERRKMKRFRLTHQQTRFLMSEFAKQAHPDAAHRERLSREIPGLSSRQVQVWFQNRRAKIKRLNVDDRERMMKMRAVPEDFDNIQALHSPYGALQGITTPMQSAVDYMPSYTDQGMMRPLMIDTLRRQGADEQISSTGLTPAFGHAGFASPVPLGSPNGISPLHIPSGDPYHSSHLTSPLSTGPRSANPFHHQSGDDNYDNQVYSRQQSRPLQPLQIRGTISRTKSESLQTPLRSSMSWKGDSLDFSSISSSLTSPVQPGRQNSFHNDQSAGNSMTTNHFNPLPESIHLTSPHLVYPPSATSFKQSAAVEPRASSDFAIGLGLDLRGEYRTPSDQAPSSTHSAASFASSFNTGGFQSAPLMAPSEFQIPRTPMGHAHSDSFIPQLGATMAPPSDYSAAYSHIVSQNRHPMAQQPFHVRQSNNVKHHHAQQSPDIAAYLHQADFDTSIPVPQRKRGYSMPGTFEVQGQ